MPTHKDAFMRTTIDMPDELLRQLKVRAALDGVTLKELVTRYVADGLTRGAGAENGATGSQPARPRRRDLPVMIPDRGRRMPALSTAELQDLLDAEDVARSIPGPRSS